MPFELHPDIPESGWKMRDNPFGYADHFDDYVDRLAKRSGLPLHIPKFIPNTRLALEATVYAKQELDAADEIVSSIFRAYFAHGRDISRREVLAEVFSEAGQDRNALLSAIDERRFAGELDGLIEEAMRMGIVVTPSALICGRLLSGDKPYQIFEEAIAECVRRE